MVTSRSALFRAVPLMLVLGGCVHSSIDSRADSQIAASRAEVNELRRSPTCPDGATLGPSCGFIVARARTPEFRDSFRSQKCAAADAPRCDVLLDEAIDRWVKQRYNLAIVADVDARCERREDKCEDALVWEKLMMSSHNETLSGAAAGRENGINDRRQALHKEETERAQREALIAAAATIRANEFAQRTNPRPYDSYPFNPYTHHVIVVYRR